jgi:3-keto-5-aminohexanoate cleavage enzyme
MWRDFVWNYGDGYEYMERVRGGFAPLIITCAVNGGVQGREMNDALPETPEEIAGACKEAYDAGASVVHIHGRDPSNLPMAAEDPTVYREINALVRERCPELIINNTTGGGPGMSMESRYRCLAAAPELASLNMGPDMSRFRLPARPAPLPHPHEEVTFDDCIPFTYGIIHKLAEVMHERGVKPEMEMYHSGQFWVSRSLIDGGLLEPPYLFQFVMGYQTSAFPTPSDLVHLVERLPSGSIFFVCGVGPYQLPMTTMSILMGGHVRVGLEDNIYYRRGEKLRGNGEAVERVVRIAKELNREIATPARAREILGLGAPRPYARHEQRPIAMQARRHNDPPS